jgi:hypothetical protein
VRAEKGDGAPLVRLQPPESFARNVHQRTDGNAFFVANRDRPGAAPSSSATDGPRTPVGAGEGTPETLREMTESASSD